MSTVYIVTAHDLDPYPVLAFDSHAKALQAISLGMLWDSEWGKFITNMPADEYRNMPRSFGIGGDVLMWLGYRPLPTPFDIEDMEVL